MSSLEVRIIRKDINDFLQLLWSRFETEIAVMGCIQSHSSTPDPETNCYTIVWNSDETTFTATIDIYHHTNNGITKIDLDVVDEVTNGQDHENTKRIKNIIIECSNAEYKEFYKKALFRIPIDSSFELSGDYNFQNSQIFIRRNGSNCYAYCYLSYLSKHQLKTLIPEKAKDIASALTVLSQNLFTYDTKSKVVCYKSGGINDLEVEIDGVFFENVEFVDHDEPILNDKLAFPQGSDIILNEILSNEFTIQSCRRFHEGILMRGGSSYPHTMSSLKDGYIIQYELLAYVSSIEALLDKSKVTESTYCPSCGHESSSSEYKISKKYKTFVSEYSDNSSTVVDAMKQLYSDRSTFVHTGRDLTFHAARGHGGPFTLNGKSEKKEAPYYYYHVHEFTGCLIRNYFFRKQTTK